MTYEVKESSYEQAWRIIRAMQTGQVFSEFAIITRMCCFRKKENILSSLADYGYDAAKIKKLHLPFWLKILPIPRSNCFSLYDIQLNHIYDLAKACDEFLFFEILFLDRKSAEKFKDKLMGQYSNEHLYAAFSSVKAQCEKYFFCGFDLDDPNFESGVAHVSDYNFTPEYLNLYFH